MRYIMSHRSKLFKVIYKLNYFIRKEFGVNSKLLGLAALTGYVVLQNSIIVYGGHRVYLMMAMRGRNMSLNLYESMDYVVINSTNNL
jgi:hypothetical protein